MDRPRKREREEKNPIRLTALPLEVRVASWRPFSRRPFSAGASKVVSRFSPAPSGGVAQVSFEGEKSVHKGALEVVCARVWVCMSPLRGF